MPFHKGEGLTLEQVIGNPAFARSYKTALNKFLAAEDAWFARRDTPKPKRIDAHVWKKQVGRRPKREDFIKYFEMPDGAWYEYGQLLDDEIERKMHERRQALNADPPPEVGSEQFQVWLARHMLEDSHFADWIKIRPGQKLLKERLEELSSKAKDGCGGDVSEFLPHQVVVYAMALLRSENLIRSHGLLAMHSTGAGKTVEGLCAMVAFWNRQIDSRRWWAIISVSTSGNQAGNSLTTLARAALKLFVGNFHFRSTVPGLAEYPFGYGVTVEQAAENIRRRIGVGLLSIARDEAAQKDLQNRIGLYTYAKFGNDLKKGLFKSGPHALHHALVIVDEVQLLLNPPASSAHQADSFRNVQMFLTTGRDLATTWVLALSATPGSTTEEVRDVMNVVEGREYFTAADFTRHGRTAKEREKAPRAAAKARGLVSYAQVQGDLHHFPRLALAPQCAELPPEHAYAQEYMKLATQWPRFHDAVRDVNEELMLPVDEATVRKHARYEKHHATYLKERAAWRKLPAAQRRRVAEPAAPRAPGSEPVAGDEQYQLEPNRKWNYYRKLREAASVITFRSQDEGELQAKEEELREDKVWTLRAFDERCTKGEHSTASSSRGTAGSASASRGPAARASASGSRGAAGKRTPCMVIACGPKLQMMVENLKRPGKHYVYTSNTQTMLIVAALLESRLGLAPVQTTCSGARTCVTCALQPGKAHYFMLRPGFSKKTLYDGETTTELSKWQDTVPHARARAMTAAFDNPLNAKGDRIKVVLADGEYYKGVDLKGLRYIHLLDPLVDFSEMIQLAGRGPRFCSHTGLPVSSWNVTLMTYRQVIQGLEGNPLNADDHVLRQSVERYQQQLGETEEVLQEASVDRFVFADNLHKDLKTAKAALQSLSCVKEKKDVKEKKLPPVLTPAQRARLQEARKRAKQRVAGYRAWLTQAQAPQ